MPGKRRSRHAGVAVITALQSCVQMTVRYPSRRPSDTELRALAHERRRFGYRRLLVLLRREGLKRLFRLYRDEGLAGPSARAGASDPWERAPG
jgi:hypothetical protein